MISVCGSFVASAHEPPNTDVTRPDGLVEFLKITTGNSQSEGLVISTLTGHFVLSNNVALQILRKDFQILNFGGV